MRVDYAAARRRDGALASSTSRATAPTASPRRCASGADAVILDLEDAVPVAAKDDARDDVRTFLDELAPGPVEAWVRINDGDRGRADLQALAGTAALAGVVVPKATPDVLAARHADAPDVALIPLVESAVAITEVTTIAASAGVRTLAIGEVDLAADLGLGDDVPDAALWALRMQVVVACAATGRSAPLGPVIRDIEDLSRLRGDRAPAPPRRVRRRAGHPPQAGQRRQRRAHADGRTRSPRPSGSSTAAARADGGVFVDDAGRMIDEAVLRSARRTLELVTPRGR